MKPAAPVVSPPSAGFPLLVALLVGVAVSSCAPQGTSTPSVLEPSPTSAATETTPPSPVGSAAEVGPCAPTALAVQLTGWTGAAGSRIGSVELRNTGSDPCAVFAVARPQLVDGQGTILIDGAPPAASQALEVVPGGLLRTDVRASNYCGPAPAPPVTVAFVLPQGLGRVVAAAAPPGGLDGVPPCLGPAGSSGTVEMQPWQP